MNEVIKSVQYSMVAIGAVASTLKRGSKVFLSFVCNTVPSMLQNTHRFVEVIAVGEISLFVGVLD